MKPGRKRLFPVVYHEALARHIARLALAALLALCPGAAGALDLQGHRGARGLAPENTLAGFAAALAIGVSTLEMDLGVTADDRLVVLHDSRLAPAITRGPDGRWLQPPTPAVRSLTLAELRTYDVGRIDPASKYAARYPKQKALDGVPMPLLAELLALPALRDKEKVCLNIEIKTSPNAPDLTARPEAMADAVVEAATRSGVTPSQLPRPGSIIA